MNTNKIVTSNLGYPRIGVNRELKKAVEAYWKGAISQEELLAVGKEIRKQNWLSQKEAGIDLIPSNDFSFYDSMLDLACLVGAVPPRYNWNGADVDVDLMFLIARGVAPKGKLIDQSTTACEMTKCFDTNYHYLVPEFYENTKFSISSTKFFDEVQEAKDLGVETKPILIGPLTFLSLGKMREGENSLQNHLAFIDKLVPVYEEILKRLEFMGVQWVQFDEPVCSFDLVPEQRTALTKIYERLSKAAPKLKLMVANYFRELLENRQALLNLPVHAVHVDCVHGCDEIDAVVSELPKDKLLSVGIVEGRNIWKNDFAQSISVLEKVKERIGCDRMIVAPSCSLALSPVSLRSETQLDAQILNWLAFAEEKVVEVVSLAKAMTGDLDESLLAENKSAMEARATSSLIHNPKVKRRCKAMTAMDAQRKSPYVQRKKAQKESLNLPEFPTTIIDSFPQTKEVRSMRAKFKKGDLSREEYDSFLKKEIATSIQVQEDMGIDVLVHGEFERNDMVEYFGEKLNGFAFTQNGWVQSYGSRCVKPPIIFGDVSRPAPMTVAWSQYAQSVAKKPVKGMLTGPVTILQWSFVRNDQPRADTNLQIAFALRDEVVDLEKAGLKAIQIDEPALREGLPLRRSDWHTYLKWAVNAFRISASGVQDATQIHTHMCYSEFNDIIESIADLDADVISVEASRSNMELLEAFAQFDYPNEIGPGVWVIHSPRIPSVDEMVDLLSKACKVLTPEQLWVNPDCGLKTRGWEETKASMLNMVEAAQKRRKEAAVPA